MGTQAIGEYFHSFLEFFHFYLTNRFRVVVRLFSNRSQMTSKYGKNISDTLVLMRIACRLHHRIIFINEKVPCGLYARTI